MILRSVGILLIFICFIFGCSNQQAYEAIQQNRQLECQKRPPVQYEECMQAHGQPYDDYQREREEIIKSTSE
ncbi:hypothetical protein [Oceanicoccus sp. KOV_DT_Chl]|uniref:hypothetical protein n=1 Tax=Oceanicoccus sp. KOV_DT_Chl TaxID=1904639 RepID=UPI000C7B3DBD|nr:hypothetical protein [Oceanicoccus sp. KOV_DT_Chl]